MTVIRPNSVSGINSITAQADEIKVFKSNGTQGGLIIGGANLNATTGISTILALNVTGNVSIAGTLTYQDVTNVDSVGIITARSTIDAQGAINLADSIIHTGDADTKIRFPAADTISFETSGAEKLRITSDGKVFIGADSTDFSDAGTFFNLKNDTYGGRIGFSNNTASAGATLMEQFAYWGTNKVAGFISLAGTDTSNKDDGLLVFYTRESGQSAAERLRIASDGKVGINENPGTAQFEVKSAQLGGTAGNTQEVVRLHSPDVSNTTSYRFTNYRRSNGTSHSSSELRFRRHVDATDMGYFGLGDGYASIGYGTAEKLRIDSSGRLLVGDANATGAAIVQVQKTSGDMLLVRNHATNYESLILSVASGTADIYASSGGSTARPDLRFITNDAERLRITSAGHVTKPYHVCFGATGNQGTYSVATGQVFAFNAYHQSYPNSRHTAYNTSTSKFTAPVAGVYSFTVNLYFRNVNLSNLFSLVPRINGSEVQGGAGDKIFFFSCQNINQDTTISGTVYLNLDAGDEVDVARRTGQAGSHSFYMPHSSFFGHLIG